MNQKVLSICIPCCKRITQVRNTLKSIYEDNSDVPLDVYEVVLSDNDPSAELECLAKIYADKSNFRYIKTACEGFMNSYYVLTYGRGELLKLHNSQVLFRKGVLRILVDEAKRNSNNKALIFYTNGFLYKNRTARYNSFDAFFNTLSYWPSWSNGFSIWRDDFEKIGNIELNRLFPHTSVFITQHYKASYIINDQQWFETQRVKGRSGHNKFEAFTIHFPSLVDECFHKGWISNSTKVHVLHDILTEFLPILLFNKYVARIEKFDISGYRTNIKRYFPKHAFAISILCVPLAAFKLSYRKLYFALNSKRFILGDN